MTPKDFDRQIRVSIALLVWVAIIAFNLGMLYSRVFAIEDKMVDEIGGLRADWERDRAEQNRRLENIENKVNP